MIVNQFEKKEKEKKKNTSHDHIKQNGGNHKPSSKERQTETPYSHSQTQTHLYSSRYFPPAANQQPCCIRCLSFSRYIASLSHTHFISGVGGSTDAYDDDDDDTCDTCRCLLQLQLLEVNNGVFIQYGRGEGGGLKEELNMMSATRIFRIAERKQLVCYEY
jgi:hypothetical protein